MLPQHMLALGAMHRGSASYTPYARNFDRANSQFLTIASNATLQTGNVDFWVSLWVRLTTLGNYRVMAGKWDAGGGVGEWQIYYNTVTGKWRLAVSSGGTASETAGVETTASAVVSTWTHLLGWHDAVNDTLNLRADNAAADSAAYASGLTAGSAFFRLGGYNSTVYHNGDLDSVAFGKSPSGGVAGVIGAIHTSLYNGGTGKRYASLSASEKSDWGLVSFWDCEGTSGESDKHGTNHLTASASVPSRVAGKV